MRLPRMKDKVGPGKAPYTLVSLVWIVRSKHGVAGPGLAQRHAVALYRVNFSCPVVASPLFRYGCKVNPHASAIRLDAALVAATCS